VNGDLLHLRPYNIAVDGTLELSQQFLVPSISAPGGETSLHPGDVLFNNTNSVELVGKTALVSAGLRAAFSNHITLIKTDTEICEGAWIALALRSLWQQGFFAQRCNKWIGQAGFNTNMLVEIPIPLPPLADQHRIVARVEALMERVREAKCLRDGAREDSDTLLQGAIADVFSEIPFHRLPLLDVLIEKPRNGWSPRCDNAPDGIPVLKLGAVLGFRFNHLAIKRTSLPVNPRAHYWLGNGDILISRSNTPELVAHAAVYSGEPNPCIYPDLLMRMRVEPSKADPQFVIYWLQSEEARTYIRAHAMGASSTMKKITQGDVCALPFPAIGVDDQHRIVAYLDSVQRQAIALKRAQDETDAELRRLEQAILDRAFRGEL
jgi:type I restriction enzyme S subunit